MSLLTVVCLERGKKPKSIFSKRYSDIDQMCVPKCMVKGNFTVACLEKKQHCCWSGCFLKAKDIPQFIKNRFSKGYVFHLLLIFWSHLVAEQPFLYWDHWGLNCEPVIGKRQYLVQSKVYRPNVRHQHPQQINSTPHF